MSKDESAQFADSNVWLAKPNSDTLFGLFKITSARKLSANIIGLIKNLFKSLAAAIRPDFYERLLVHSLTRHVFASLSASRTFDNREALWDFCLSRFESQPINFVEFGVWQGYSIDYFRRKNTHASSTFVGLDSFEGLPEDWENFPKGSLSTKGKPPSVDDPRITFIKGWFQDSIYNFLNITKSENLIVHYDADLYSSTLFCLSKMDTLNHSYIAIFDEFTGHESRALYNYKQSHLASVEFMGRTLLHNKQSLQVMCRVTPHRAV